ncbi:DUF6371 domain-containing protein [Salinimicrobium sediminilitoris]|uniref:DUF6371 domain-containing protein n=1 Tax=Salinimicrobium sediminilitoris TaxID=2876715 RepID=UPI001E540F5F|nr:DUF6371 domain-containing protein [Salinimicrobium sediminilitoris]MCC8358378.1 DUF6371 domain-containing protein [Salinimicrobium sediminilitoris]
MPQYRFTLEPYISQKNRFQCPSCGKKHSFTRYIDLEKKEYISENVGKCNREQKCGYHLKPKDFFQSQTSFAIDHSHQNTTINPAVLRQVAFQAKSKSLPPSFIEEELYLKSLEGSSANNFLVFLEAVIGKDALIDVREKYRIGTSKKWKGTTVFWQIDEQNIVRTGKMMLYNKYNGKKQKVNWAHSVLKLPDYNLKQCLFGLHLLNLDKQKAIALVESEKTAIIASIAFPEFIWMATGGLMNLKASMLKPLANRKVILFPDAGCYNTWNEKVGDLPKNIQYLISDLVEKKATSEEKQEGWDIADYILRIWGGKDLT